MPSSLQEQFHYAGELFPDEKLEAIASIVDGVVRFAAGPYSGVGTAVRVSGGQMMPRAVMLDVGGSGTDPLKLDEGRRDHVAQQLERILGTKARCSVMGTQLVVTVYGLDLG